MELVERFKKDVKDHPSGYILYVAEETGVPAKTLRNLYYGVTRAMHYDQMLKLGRYYSKIDARAKIARRGTRAEPN